MAPEIEHPHVAGVEPAILVSDFGSGLRVIEVPLHHIWTFCRDLPVFCYLDVDLRDRLSYCAILEVIKPIGGENRSCLCQSVSFDDQNTDRFEELSEFPGKRRSAGDKEPNSPPVFCFNFENTNLSARA